MEHASALIRLSQDVLPDRLEEPTCKRRDYTKLCRVISTYRLEHIDLLRRAIEHGPVLLEILLNHVLPRRAPVANGFHLHLHLPRVLASLVLRRCQRPRDALASLRRNGLLSDVSKPTLS